LGRAFAHILKATFSCASAARSGALTLGTVLSLLITNFSRVIIKAEPARMGAGEGLPDATICFRFAAGSDAKRLEVIFSDR
jgi:hypothetical protein